jgi:hypothetical protein
MSVLILSTNLSETFHLLGRIEQDILKTYVCPIVLNLELSQHHHHKHQCLGHLARSVSRATAALANVSSVSQLFSFIVDCSGMILK